MRAHSPWKRRREGVDSRLAHHRLEHAIEIFKYCRSERWRLRHPRHASPRPSRLPWHSAFFTEDLRDEGIHPMEAQLAVWGIDRSTNSVSFKLSAHTIKFWTTCSLRSASLDRSDRLIRSVATLNR
jgi:hypothetical protein